MPSPCALRLTARAVRSTQRLLVKAAVEASRLRQRLVIGKLTNPRAPEQDSSEPVPLTALAYGDDGLNMTIAESAAELVSYIRTMNQARPNIRFVLLEDVVLGHTRQAGLCVACLSSKPAARLRAGLG